MDTLDRLHHALRAAIERAGATSRSITVAEVYQHLVPYRAMRGELGVWELAEYEHALLRLLSGEGGLVTVVAPEAAEEFRRELASPNPILGIYRDYPGVEVRLGGGAAAGNPPELRAAPGDDPTPTPSSCFACSAPLPPVHGLRFCPACGTDQLTAPCPGCGNPYRAEWNFCIRCGTSRDGERARRRGE